MDSDPYFVVKAEVVSSLASASTLHSSYARILRTLPASLHATSEELSWARAELKATLAGLSLEIDELEETVSMLLDRDGEAASRLGLSLTEVGEREKFIHRVRSEIKMMRGSIVDSLDSPLRPSLPSGSTYRPSLENDRDNPEEEFEAQHQSLLMERQDDTLSSISGTVGLLRDQARLMGAEVIEQNGMLDDLDMHVDGTSTRLANAQKKMTKFLRQNQDSPASWCILVLIIVLSILLLVILFF